LRQYLFSLRKSVIGGGEDAYEEAFKITPEEFDQQFDKYLKDRFKPFRDKERPADYGRNLLPNPEKTPFRGGYTVEPSPSGDLLAVFAGNARDREGDILLVVRNLTKGSTRSRLRVHHHTGAAGCRASSRGRRPRPSRLLRSRGEVAHADPAKRPDEHVEPRRDARSMIPEISPPTVVAFAALQNGTGDIFVVDLQTEEVTNVTKDGFADSAPTWSPDGQSVVTTRASRQRSCSKSTWRQVRNAADIRDSTMLQRT
jgi:dipeptidyl aminopeptidase/acylaminoacyl peptidase